MRFRGLRTREDDTTYELNLAPMLALIVTLIPVLLLSVIFMRIVMIETPIPQVVADAIEDNKDKKDVIISLNLSLNGLRISVLENSKRNDIKIVKDSNGYDLATLHKEMVKLKQKHPTVFRIEMKPDSEITYLDIVAVIDAVRRNEFGDPMIKFQDKGGELIETDLLFPDVVFGNVVEG